MKKPISGSAVVAALMSLAFALCAPAEAAGIKRLYVLDCGRQIGKDQSRWTPGINVGQPIELSNNCALVQHERGTLLWETGVPDAIAGQRDGVTVAQGAIVMFRDQTLMGQLESLGVKPEAIERALFARRSITSSEAQASTSKIARAIKNVSGRAARDHRAIGLPR